MFLCVVLINITGMGQYNDALLAKAKNGSVAAQMKLAQCYLDGDGVDWSESEALKWYEKAAENNNIEAMVACGDLLCKDVSLCDLEPDYIRGLEWYRKAASKGNSKAKERVSNFETSLTASGYGEDCPFTWLPFVEEFEQLEFLKGKRDVIDREYGKKNPIAAYYLAILAFADKDFTNVVKYLSEIYPLVMDENNYYEDIFEQDDSKLPLGITLHTKVASLLGCCYELGLGVGMDYVKAASYYLSATADAALGLTSIPEVRGAYCLRKANLYDKFINEVNNQKLRTDGDHRIYYVPWLRLKLAEMYIEGVGLPQNKQKGLEIYESIVEQRKGILSVAVPVPEYKSFSHMGEAAYRASRMYKTGEGCRKDEEMADLYFEIALKYGNAGAWNERKNK